MMARILCLIVLALEARGLSLSISDRKWTILIFYTQLSNLITTVSAFFLVIFGQRGWVSILRYLSSCMLVMTFIVTTCVLIPMGGNPKKLLWSGNGLYHHVLCPVVSTISYVFFERHADFSMFLLPVLLTLGYGLVMLFLNKIGKVDGPYPFFRVNHQSGAATIFWMMVLTASIAGISTMIGIIAK